MRNIGIFRLELFAASETFITEQANALPTFRPTLIGRNLLGAPIDASVNLQVADTLKVRQRGFTLFPNLAWFNGAQRKVIKSCHLFHAHFGPDATYALPLAKQLKKPLLATFHGYDVLINRDELYATGGVRLAYFRRQEIEMVKYCSRLIAVSDYAEKAMLRLGYPQEKIVRHYIGVDLSKFSSMQNDTEVAPYILSVARHVPYKAIDIILRAFAKLTRKFPSLKLKQVGSGPISDELKALAVDLGIADKVDFLGSRSHDDVRVLMRQAVAFCGVPRTTETGASEALGVVFCEAAASGIPTIATRSGGVPEVVKHGETGFLVSENDIDATANALDALLSDPFLCRQMGNAARDWMGTQFDIRKQSASLERIYEQVLDEWH